MTGMLTVSLVQLGLDPNTSGHDSEAVVARIEHAPVGVSVDVSRGLFVTRLRQNDVGMVRDSVTKLSNNTMT